MRTRTTLFATVPTVFVTLACADQPPAAPPTNLPAALGAAAVLPLDAFGLHAPGLAGAGCVAPQYRQFDFWLGQWEVLDPTGVAFLGTNIVEQELDGCAVEENWTGSGGVRGRSINSYDASTDTWSQFWVAAGGGLGGVLLLEGGLEGESMVMSGDRVFADFGGFTITDRIAWTVLPDQSVQQLITTDPDNGTFDGRYHRREQVTPPAEQFIPTCSQRATSREMDFLLGGWVLRPGPSHAADGGSVTSVVTTDLNECLIEERISGPGRYEGWSFAVWSAIDHDWHRWYVDNEGRRLVLRGGMSGDAMVMSGQHRSTSGGVIDVRISWTPAADGDVAQRWELSRDGGAKWRHVRTVRYARQ